MRVVTFGLGGADPTKLNNNIVEEYEIADPPHRPLDAAGVAATLNVVLGLWGLQDAANAIGLEPQTLVNEAQAWAAAQVG